MSKLSTSVGRRTILKAGVALGASQVVGAPFVIRALGEEPVKIGMVNPLTGVLSALAQSEVDGAKYAEAEINKKGGILGRQVQLLVEDSANDVGTGVQKTRKLIDRDKVDVIFGDVNSGIAYAMSQVTNEKKVFHIVPGGHTDPITGTDCKWNVFRVCNTTTMDAAAVTPELVKRFGKKWFFITPDYAYGHTLQDAFVKELKKAGGNYEGDMLPINNTEFSATLIKAKGYKPNVLLNNMGGLAQINCMKQFTQFGMQKDMALGGALFELESIKGCPTEAQTGWWTWNGGGTSRRCRRWRSSSPISAPRPRRRPRRATGSATSRCIRCGSPPRRRSRSRARSWRWRWRTWNCRPTWRCSRARCAIAPATTN